MPTYSGTWFNDSLPGSTGNDTIYGDLGQDTIDGLAGNDALFGGDGNDRVYGGIGDDSLHGDAGSDTLWGGSGNDKLYDGAGADTLYGDAGNDTLYGTSGTNSFFGGAGSDLVYGGNDADTAYGGADNDTIYGNAGNDALTGNQGADLLDGGGGNDSLQGGQGGDTLYGGAGADNLLGDGQWLTLADYASGTGTTATTLTIVNGADGPIHLYYINESGASTYYATIQPGQTYVQSTYTQHNWVLRDDDNYFLDVITGAPGQTYTYSGGFGDTIYGGDGDDSLTGQYGNDLLYGDAGRDTIFGGYGNDTVFAGSENDSINAGAGDDTLYGGSQDDIIHGGDGNDVIGDWSMDDSGNDTVYGDAGNDSVIGGAGNDTVYGGTGDDTLSGQTGADTIYGGDGQDLFLVTEDHETDTIFGGEGGTDLDTLSLGLWQSTQGVAVTFTGSEAGSYLYSAGSAASGSFSEIEATITSDAADTVDAWSSSGGINVDTAGGADTILGSAFGDTIMAGAGNDAIWFGAGNDTVYAGDGDDILDDTSGTQLAGNDTIYGGAGNDTAYLGQGDDLAYGGDGTDVLFGEEGADRLFGDAGNDSLYGGAGNDSIDGGLGNDTISGGAGDDTLSGGAGSDLIYAGIDTDTVTTGTGNDTIQLAADTTPGVANDHVTVVEDFDLGDVDLDGKTNDQIDVSGLVDAQGGPINFSDVVITDDGLGNAVLTFPMGEVLVLKGVSPSQIDTAPLMNRIGIPCFTTGTLIRTPSGEVPVETLRPGDLILTRDNGPMPLLWSGLRRLDRATLDRHPEFLPVRIAPGTWGAGRGLLVSQQHGVLMATDAPGGGERLIRATHLARLKGGRVRIARGVNSVTYVHLLFDGHQIVWSNGIPTESFYPGKMAMGGLDSSAKHEVLSLFPDIAYCDAFRAYGPTVRPFTRFRNLPDSLKELAVPA